MMKFTDMKEEAILSIVEPLMDNCLNGSNEDDHARHVRDFTDRMRRIVTPENLERQLSQNPRAFFTSREFVYLFRRRDSIGVVWKQYMSSSSDEFMNQAIFVEQDNKILIDHCMVC